MPSLGSARAKWERARVHTEALYHEFREHCRAYQPCSIGFHMDYERREKFWHVEGPPEPPPSFLGLIAGDALQNYRASLDHLAWQLVLANRKTPGRHTQFPIFHEPDKFATRGQSMMRGMSAPAKAVIRDEQPCFGTNPFRVKWMRGLEELGNIDKHRYVNLVLAATSGGMWSYGLGNKAHATSFIYNGPIEAGTKLASIGMDYADVGFGAFLDVAFGEPGPAYGESAYSLLIGIRELIKQLLDTFDYGGFGFTK